VALDERLVCRHGVDAALDRLRHAIEETVYVLGRNLID
jgi:hypothetical protein